jgi:hypothetical protein
MRAILIVAWLLLVPVGVAGAAFVAFLALGQVFSTGEDGDPPPQLVEPAPGE